MGAGHNWKCHPIPVAGANVGVLIDPVLYLATPAGFENKKIELGSFLQGYLKKKKKDTARND